MWEYRIGDRVRRGRFIGRVVGHNASVGYDGLLRLGYRVEFGALLGGERPERWEVDAPEGELEAIGRDHPVTL